MMLVLLVAPVALIVGVDLARSEWIKRRLARDASYRAPGARGGRLDPDHHAVTSRERLNRPTRHLFND